MYKPRYVQYINLPQIPIDIIQSSIANIPNYLSNESIKRGSSYIWTDYQNAKLDSWCKHNICKDMYFAFQVMTADVQIHKDVGTKTKFCYILKTGGDNVITSFYDDDKTTLLDSYCIVPEQWHILKVDTYHGVTNIHPGEIRFSITAKIFE